MNAHYEPPTEDQRRRLRRGCVWVLLMLAVVVGTALLASYIWLNQNFGSR